MLRRVFRDMLLSSRTAGKRDRRYVLRLACTISDSLRPHAREVARQSFHFVCKTVLIRHGAESRVHDWCLTFDFYGPERRGHGMLRVFFRRSRILTHATDEGSIKRSEYPELAVFFEFVAFIENRKKTT